MDTYDNDNMPKRWFAEFDEVYGLGVPSAANIWGMGIKDISGVKGVGDIFSRPPQSNEDYFNTLWGGGVAGSPVSKEPITINFTTTNKKNIIEVGELVKIAGKKRIWGEVTQSNYESATLKSIYRPAPKSVLNNIRSPFSKMKMKIVKH